MTKTEANLVHWEVRQGLVPIPDLLSTKHNIVRACVDNGFDATLLASYVGINKKCAKLLQLKLLQHMQGMTERTRVFLLIQIHFLAKTQTEVPYTLPKEAAQEQLCSNGRFKVLVNLMMD